MYSVDGNRRMSCLVRRDLRHKVHRLLFFFPRGPCLVIHCLSQGHSTINVVIPPSSQTKHKASALYKYCYARFSHASYALVLTLVYSFHEEMFLHTYLLGKTINLVDNFGKYMVRIRVGSKAAESAIFFFSACATEPLSSSEKPLPKEVQSSWVCLPSPDSSRVAACWGPAQGRPKPKLYLACQATYLT